MASGDEFRYEAFAVAEGRSLARARKRLVALAMVSLAIALLQVATMGGRPYAPALLRLADLILLGAALAVAYRVNSLFIRRARPAPVRDPEVALLWVLAGATALALVARPVASLLALAGAASDTLRLLGDILGLNMLSLIAKLALVYVSLRAGAVVLAAMTPGRLPRLAFPPAAAVALSFAIMILLGAALLSLPFATALGQPPDPLDALFTATSASCVTGLIVQDTPSYWSTFGHIVILVLLQIGGLGTMTLAAVLRLLLRRRLTVLEQLAVRDTIGPPGLADIVRVVRRIILFTVVCEIIGAALLASRWWAKSAVMPAGYAAWIGLFHSVSAFCNAGFSLFSTSLEHYVGDLFTVAVIGGLIIIGGLGFPVIIDVARWLKAVHLRRRRFLTLHSRLVIVTTALLLTIGFAALLVLEWDGAFSDLPPATKVLAAAFAAITPRTAGFDTVPPARFTTAGKLLTIILMFIGASPGSTGGGIKTATFAVLALLIWVMSRGQEDIYVFRRSLGEGSRHRAFAIAGLMTCAVFALTLTLCITEAGKADFIDILFEAVSALGTVGLSCGVTRTLSAAGKLAIIVAMYVGRVGPLTLALSIAPRRRPPFRFPAEDVMVG